MALHFLSELSAKGVRIFLLMCLFKFLIAVYNQSANGETELVEYPPKYIFTSILLCTYIYKTYASDLDAINAELRIGTHFQIRKLY